MGTDIAFSGNPELALYQLQRRFESSADLIPLFGGQCSDVLREYGPVERRNLVADRNAGSWQIGGS